MHCLESARLLSERRDHPLPLAKRLAHRFHLALCAVCRTYEKQLQAVCGIAHHAGASPSSHGATLPPGRKQAMQDAIDHGTN